MFRHKVLKAPGDCLYLKKYLLRTFHSCSSLCFVPLPPLQCYLGQNLKMKERKWSVWEASCVTSGFGSCWGRPVRTLWGRRDQVRGRTTPPLSEGFVMPGQLSRECLSVLPSGVDKRLIPSPSCSLCHIANETLKSSPWPRDSSCLADLFYPSINVKQRCFITIL